MDSTEPALTARERFYIASDVARALAFLHTVCDPPIIHQDIKSANILLGVAPRDSDCNLVAKLADFGTVRLVPELAGTKAPTHHSTRNVVGTGPYMPLEYVQAGHTGPKTDAFAFGVVLLELLTGRPPSDRVKKTTLVVQLDSQLNSQDLQRTFAPLLDAAAPGGWDRGTKRAALALADIARRLVQPRVTARSVVSEVVPNIDALAGRSRDARSGRGRWGLNLRPFRGKKSLHQH